MWHADETWLRLGGKWRYLWRAVDQNGKVVDFRLTARRDVEATRAFFRQAGEMNKYELPGEGIQHIDRKWRNNRIESDHTALKRLTPRRGFKSLSSAKATLKGIEVMRMIKNGHVLAEERGVAGEVRFVRKLFILPAQ